MVQKQTAKPKMIKLDFDKIIGFFIKHQSQISVVLFSLVFVYGLCMATPMAKLMFLESPYSDTLLLMTPIIDEILIISFIGVVFSLFYPVMRNNVRRIYYPSNIVYQVMLFVFTLFVGAFFLRQVIYYNGLFNAIDREYVDMMIPIMTGNEGSTLEWNTPVFWMGKTLGAFLIIEGLSEFGELLYKLLKGDKIRQEIYGEPAVKVEVK